MCVATLACMLQLLRNTHSNTHSREKVQHALRFPDQNKCLGGKISTAEMLRTFVAAIALFAGVVAAQGQNPCFDFGLPIYMFCFCRLCA